MPDELKFQVNDAERKYLQEMTRHPGYKVLQQIMSNYVDGLTLGAVLLSKQDPLANAEAIAQRWAYIGMAETLLARIKDGVGVELTLLQVNEEETDPTLAERRRLHALLGELDPIPQR